MTEKKDRGIEEVLNSAQDEPFDFNSMFDRLNSMTDKICGECGQQFRGLPETDICLECSYKRDHPEARDKYWTWSRAGGSSWKIVAYWPEREEMPSVGERITVHRRDGSTSVEVIHEVEGLRYRPDGRAQVSCMIE